MIAITVVARASCVSTLTGWVSSARVKALQSSQASRRAIFAKRVLLEAEPCIHVRVAAVSADAIVEVAGSEGEACGSSA